MEDLKFEQHNQFILTKDHLARVGKKTTTKRDNLARVGKKTTTKRELTYEQPFQSFDSSIRGLVVDEEMQDQSQELSIMYPPKTSHQPLRNDSSSRERRGY